MVQNRPQIRISVKPFSGKHEDFPEWEMDTEAAFELEGLEECLKMINSSGNVFLRSLVVNCCKVF